MHRSIGIAMMMGTLAMIACDNASEPVPAAPEFTRDEGSSSSRARDELGPSPVGSPIPVAVQLVAQALTSPITIVSANDRTGRLFIVDQTGTIHILTREGVLLPTPFLDVKGKIVPLNPNFDERGLLGLAFHPKYRKNGRFFVYYSAPLQPGAPAGYDHTARIAEYRVSSNPNVADPTSERIILEIHKPQFNHNGGTLAFGKDDFLYISIGDGGGANDVGLGHVEDWYADNEGGNGQDTEQNLLGNILRIDIDGALPYGIPRNNPFVGRAGRDEIYAYGLRNPYRMSFDMKGGHRLFAGDAGQGLWEEVSIIERGGNYGWNVREGTHCFDAENNTVSPPDCPRAEQAPSPHAGTPLRNPIIEYANSANSSAPPETRFGVTVIGGHVYRGERIERLEGRYVFGDFSRTFFPPNGSLLSASGEGRRLWTIRELTVANRPAGRLGHYVLGFGQDDRGEIYVGVRDVLGPTGNTGKVYKLVAANGGDEDDDDDDDDDDNSGPGGGEN
jgi:glucose/arabinose dehydrogenase